jgi:hypothetical protein
MLLSPTTPPLWGILNSLAILAGVLVAGKWVGKAQVEAALARKMPRTRVRLST